MLSEGLFGSQSCYGGSPISRLLKLPPDSRQSAVGGSEGPRSAPGNCTFSVGKFAETVQRCEDKQENWKRSGASLKRRVLA